MTTRSVPLLLAVHECVSHRATSPANGGSPVIWPRVVDALARLQPDAGWTDSTARKAYRNVRGLGPAERRNLIETVDEPYEAAVDAVMGVEEAKAPAPVVPVVAAEESPMDGIEFPDLKHKADPGWGLDFLDKIADIQDVMRSMDTQQNVAHAVINTNLPIGVVFPGDFHFGGRGTNHRLMKQDMLMWKALGDAVKVAGMGDYSEQFTGKLASIGSHQHVVTADMQIEVVMDLFCGILKEQWLVFLEGNHDGWAGAELARYVMRMAQRCNVPFLGKGGELFLTVGEVKYKLALWHRYPGASALNKGNNQRRVRIDHNGSDVVALAHLHNAYTEFSQTGDQNHVGLRCGAYKTVDEHSRDAAGNVVADSRVPMVVFNPRARDTLHFEDYHKGIETLLRLRRDWHHHPSFLVDSARLQTLMAQ